MPSLSTSRRPIVAGNWKMHKLSRDAAETARDLDARLRAAGPLPAGEVLVCPPFTALWAVGGALGLDGGGAPTLVGLGAQDCHWAETGAFTGEVSPGMLRDAGCRAVLAGHSERRATFGETDANVNAKAVAALGAGLLPIICVGETLDQREAGETDRVLRTQVAAAVTGLAPLASSARLSLVFAYEPVWAIGTGRAAGVQDAVAAARTIRAALPADLDPASVRVLYGGSVKPSNVATFMAEPDVDGVLVGGASLDAAEFAALTVAGLGAAAGRR